MDAHSITIGLVAFIIIAALIFDYTNGFHDAANSIATVVSTRVLSPHLAVIWAAAFNFIAFLIFGTRVAKTVGGDMVDLTEAPEDAVSSLVTDLLQYCEREKIDWTQEVMSRAWEGFRSERACEVQKRTFLKPSETERTSHRRARLD